jgi:hypothetical protein
MSSRQQLGCFTAVADVVSWIWAGLVWLASEVWSGFVLELWERWRGRKE